MVPVQRKMHCKMFDKFPREHDQQINPLLNIHRTSQDRSPTTLAIVGHQIQEARGKMYCRMLFTIFMTLCPRKLGLVSTIKKEMVF